MCCRQTEQIQHFPSPSPPLEVPYSNSMRATSPVPEHDATHLVRPRLICLATEGQPVLSCIVQAVRLLLARAPLCAPSELHTNSLPQCASAWRFALRICSLHCLALSASPPSSPALAKLLPSSEPLPAAPSAPSPLLYHCSNRLLTLRRFLPHCHPGCFAIHYATAVVASITSVTCRRLFGLYVRALHCVLRRCSRPQSAPSPVSLSTSRLCSKGGRPGGKR